MKQVLSLEPTSTPSRAISIWEALPIQSVAPQFGNAPAELAMAPRCRVVKSLGSVGPVSNIHRNSAGPRRFTLLAMGIPVQKSSASPFFSPKEPRTVDSRKKPGNVTIPGSSGRMGVNFASESGLIDGIPPAFELPPVSHFHPTPQTGTGSWRATPQRPFAPNDAPTETLAFVPASAPPDRFTGRALPVRENQVPYRSWHGSTHSPSISSRSLSEANGFILAVPPNGNSSKVRMSESKPFRPWIGRTNHDFPGLSFLDQCEVLWDDYPPTDAGARTLLPLIKPVASISVFQPGLHSPYPGDKPFLAEEAPFVKDVENKMPLAQHAAAPGPVIAFSSGFLTWMDPLNSYVRRNPCPPRFRENSRIVHALRLAPARIF